MRRIALGLLLGFVSLAGTARAEDIWSLNFTFRAPRRITVKLPGEEKSKTVWYMIYRVSNPTNQPRPFQPRFYLVTDDGKVHDESVIAGVEADIRAAEGITQPLLDGVRISVKPIEPSGEGKPRETYGVVCWNDVSPHASGFTIYVNGLTNAFTRVSDLKAQKETVRHKMLKLSFDHPAGSEQVKLAGDLEWIYR
jgi:hypothetical protein